MAETGETSLRQVLELTRKLRALIEQGFWEEALSLEMERMRLLKSGVLGRDAQLLECEIALCKEIQRQGQELQSLGHAARDKLAGQLRELKQGRRAGQAYQQANRLSVLQD